MSSLLEAKHVKKYFKVPAGQLHAVDDVSFSIDEGHTMGVVGESGCGKSTLGRVILRLLEPTAGKVIFEGKDLVQMDRHEMHKMRQKIQMIFQDPFSSIDPRMSVYDTIAEPLKIYQICKNPQEIRARVKEIMDTVGLAQRLMTSYPHELDGGRRQRIGIARALILEPRFIVCDEPVSALDVSIQAQILNLMQDLQKERGLTYMFITHDLSVVRHISTAICVMYLGEIVEMCPAKELFISAMHPYTQALLSAIPIPDITLKRQRILLKGELSSPINPSPGCRFAPRCLYATDQCRAQAPEFTGKAPGHYVACHRCGGNNIAE